MLQAVGEVAVAAPQVAPDKNFYSSILPIRSVINAHSKRGMFDFMIGSLTRHLIEAAKKPLLIGQ